MKNRYEAEQLQFNQEQLVFDENSFECSFEGPIPLKLEQINGHSLSLVSEGFTHWMIWNPSSLSAADLTDLPPADWQRFVCIEPVVLNPLILEPGNAFNENY
jgi:glucose-6-phosphate 1-epimerase